MRRTEPKRLPVKQLIYLYLFLFLVLALFLFNVVIALPIWSEYDITQEGQACLLENKHGTWYVLDEDSYTVEQSYRTIRSRATGQAVFRFLVNEYKFYKATVTSTTGETFTMPIRVSEKKAKEIEQGNIVRLYGMASSLTGDDLDAWETESAWSIYPSINMCLNDNGDFMVSRMGKAVTFSALSFGTIWIMVRIWKKQRKAREAGG